MTRWVYDTVFYRVFCSALLVVALTFTVILTNVFIDIDGLLYKNNKEKLETVQADVEDVITTNMMPHDVYDDKDYVDSYGERTKRSLETQNYAFRIKDPNIKKVITNRLAALLDDLDKEEPKSNPRANQPTDHHNAKNEKYKDIKVITEKNYNSEFELVDTKKARNNIVETIKQEQYNHDEDLKHLAMHNIILQGIVGHMELGEVYERVHALFHNNLEGNKVNLKEVLHPVHEKIFFNELTNCKQLHKEIAETTKPEVTTKVENIKATAKPSGRNVMIKTIIDITSLVNDKTNQDDASSKENVNGIIKLIYNGKSLKFRRVDEMTTTIKPSLSTMTSQNEKLSTIRMDTENMKNAEDKILDSDKKESTYVPNAFMHKMISDYLKRLSKEATLENNKKITTKRLKRHIKIRFENEHTSTTTETSKYNKKKGEDELYVEIETHFDSKGLKGEKKKKIITDLIEKIQKAIHSDNEVKKKKHKHLHVKKRTQNPLDNANTASLVNKMLVPLNNLVHRHIAPISKSVPLHEKLPRVSDEKGEDWREKYYGPRFLTATKAINSAEISEVDTDYNKIMDNGIPQRLQKPLNTEASDSIVNFNRHDPGNSQYIVRDIAGSGFSIGFNQYVDEQPDAESMKLFTGIENIIQTYHQKYDEGGNANVNAENIENPLKQEIIEEPVHYEYPSSDDHTIVRRSIKKFKQDYHSNEYKVIFNKNFLNYNNYQDVYNKGHKIKGKYPATEDKNKDIRIGNNLLIDDSILNKELKPAEIFSLADILERQKRALNVKKITNIKNKKKLNRYINTKSMATKKIFQQNKRNKRQIGKIRIIAKDISENHKHPSGEDIFVFSDEKVFADRAMIKEVETPEIGPKDTMKEENFDVITPQQISEDHFDASSPQHISEDHFDIISPQKGAENHYDIISPYIFEAPLSDISGPNSIFARKSRHNSLMSKYPHIFMEEISKSKEDFSDNQIMYENVKVATSTQVAPTIVEIPQAQYIPETKLKYNPDVQDTIDYPPPHKGNYKVTVKIMPKNKTGLNSGFKEIHTSINKSYNRNGLMYTSLVNVSEISKVEKINKTKDKNEYTHPSVQKLKREQIRIKNIIQQHKDRIEEQLAHLNREKEKLDRIDIRNTDILKDIPKDYMEVIPNNPERTLHIYKEDTGQSLNIVETTTEPHTTTTEYVQPITEDPEKLKIIKTIERNENITNEILQKIDKNTNILQTFLDKIISKMEAKETTKKESKIPDKEDNKLNSETPKAIELSDNNLSQLLFKMPRKNMSGMPFVYAFQQPYKIHNGDTKNPPIASVVYQGHIHAQTFKPEINRKMWTDKEKEKDFKPKNIEVKNSSKFFIDDLEEYKVLPVVGKTLFSSNTTKV